MCPGRTFSTRSRPVSVIFTVVLRSSLTDGLRVMKPAFSICQRATAVDDQVCEIGHPALTFRGVSEPSQDQELHTTDVAVGAELLLDGVLQVAADLHEREERGEFTVVQWFSSGRSHSDPSFEFCDLLQI